MNINDRTEIVEIKHSYVVIKDNKSNFENSILRGLSIYQIPNKEE